MEDSHRVTRLLKRWSRGDEEALDEIVPLIYDELRRLAHHRLRGERSNHTLNTTALVHEAYVKLVDVNDLTFRGRSHFLAMASRIMRRFLGPRRPTLRRPASTPVAGRDPPARRACSKERSITSAVPEHSTIIPGRRSNMAFWTTRTSP